MQVKNLQSPTKQAKFKIGDFVKNLAGSLLGKVVDLFYYPIDDCWIYCVNNNATMYNESHLQLIDYPENGTITETATKTGVEYQFEVGKQYEFSYGEDWVKGKAVGTVDYEGQRNFVVEINGKLSVFESIRPIQEIAKEDLSNLLNTWLELWQSEHLIESSLEYQLTISDLVRNTEKILQQLTQTK